MYVYIFLINHDNLYARIMWWTAVSTFCVFEAAAPHTCGGARIAPRNVQHI